MNMHQDPARHAYAPTHRNANDLDRLREEWRLTAVKQSAARNLADRLEEGRKMLKDQLALALVDAKMPMQKAMMAARTSQQFRDYCHRLYDAKKVANDLYIEMQNRERIYWEAVNAEANERSEKRMSR